ncbi:hypothetical protein NDU88_003046, partial [Pleurodeles waltl]
SQCCPGGGIREGFEVGLWPSKERSPSGGGLLREHARAAEPRALLSFLLGA